VNRVARRGIGLAGGLTLALGAGAILGVALGRSAIAEINPIHYRDPPPLRVAGDDTGPAQDSFGQAYDWNQGAVARAVDCGGDCDRREARDAASFTFDAPPAPHDDAVFAEPPPWPPGAVDDGRGPAEQYAHYPIEAKPADAEPAAPAAPLAVPKDDAAAGQ
jgi:hypothetical protein